MIGIAGSEEKCSILTDQLGFDVAINYNKQNIKASKDSIQLVVVVVIFAVNSIQLVVVVVIVAVNDTQLVVVVVAVINACNKQANKQMQY